MFFDTRPKVIVLVEETGEHYPCTTSESLLALTVWAFWG